MACTVIGLFDSESQAEMVEQRLVAAGIPEHNIRISPQASEGASSGSTAYASEDKSFWQEIKDLFSGDDMPHHADYYAEGTRRGGALITVTAEDSQATAVSKILRDNKAVDIESRASEWAKSGWTGYQTNPSASAAVSGKSSSMSGKATTPNQQNVAVPIVQEQLEVGKREVQGGGVRVIRRVTEQPVQQDINLREERVDVQRRAVDRNLTTADLNDAFKDKTIEVTETSEVAVAAKTAKVVEEVVVNKDVKQRTEQVRDTVRRSDVQVERLPGRQTSESTTKSSESTTGSTTPDRSKTPKP